MRYRAFTLLEVTVALLLTSLLVVLSYGIVGGFSRSADAVRRLHDGSEDLRTTQQAITADMDAASRCSLDGDGIVCDRPDGRVRYIRTEGKLLRERHGDVDTLLRRVTGLHPARSAEMDRTGVDPTLIDRIAVSSLLEGDTIHFVVYKWYDARTLVEVFDNGSPATR